MFKERENDEGSGDKTKWKWRSERQKVKSDFWKLRKLKATKDNRINKRRKGKGECVF